MTAYHRHILDGANTPATQDRIVCRICEESHQNITLQFTPQGYNLIVM
jgi:hypothetical protein